MSWQRALALVVFVAGIVFAIYYLDPGRPSQEVVELTTADVSRNVSEKESSYPRAVELVNPDGFINVDEFQLADIVGKKVILVDFWTYSCINCQRTTPYLNAWYEKYRDQGLEIVGVHTPEFDFEKEYDNVVAAVKKENIQYPVVLDNEYATWQAYKNRYWPHKYLIDIDGFIVYDHIGEGAYDETEMQIKAALAERAERLGTATEQSDALVQVEGEIVGNYPRTPEIYFGAARNELLGNGAVGAQGVSQFDLTNNFVVNHFYLSGRWDIRSEFARSVSADAKIVLPFSGKKVFMVAASAEGAEVAVVLDGLPIGSDAGANVEDATVRIQNEDLYRLVELPEAGSHRLELHIISGTLDAFTFTFG